MNTRLHFSPKGVPGADADFDIRPPSTPCQHRSARELMHRMYAWRGYRNDAHPLPAEDASRLVLAAWRGERVAGTLTVGADSPRGLLSEALYGKEVRALRRANRVLCEFSRLAVDPGFSARELLVALFRTAYEHACHRFRATDLVIEVNPRHSRYYQRIFGFRQVGELRHCPRVDAPAVLLHRELDAAPEFPAFSCAGGA